MLVSHGDSVRLRTPCQSAAAARAPACRRRQREGWKRRGLDLRVQSHRAAARAGRVIGGVCRHADQGVLLLLLLAPRHHRVRQRRRDRLAPHRKRHKVRHGCTGSSGGGRQTTDKGRGRRGRWAAGGERRAVSGGARVRRTIGALALHHCHDMGPESVSSGTWTDDLLLLGSRLQTGVHTVTSSAVSAGPKTLNEAAPGPVAPVGRSGSEACSWRSS